MEAGALLILGPAANAAPNGREDAGKTGQSAKNPIQKGYACIRRCSAALDGLHRRPCQAVSAVEHEHQAHRDANVVRPRPFENRDSQRDSKRAAEQEPPEPTPLQRVPQFPDRDARTTRPKAMIKVAVCAGVRMCSQMAAATKPNANPAIPVTNAAANVAVR